MKKQIGSREVLSMGVYRIKSISEIVDILKARAKEDLFVQELLNKYGFDTSIIDSLPINVMVNKRVVSPYGYFSPSKRAIFLQIPFFAKEHLLNSIQAEIKECERERGGYKRRLNEARKAIEELEKQSSEYSSPSLLETWKRSYEFYMKEVAEKEERIKFLQEKLKDLEGKSEEELYQMGKFQYTSRDNTIEAAYDVFIHELRHYLDWLYKKQKPLPQEQRIPDIRKRRKPWYQRDEEISAMVTEIKRWQSIGLSKEEMKERLSKHTFFFKNFDIDKFLEDALAGKYDDYFETRKLESVKLSDRKVLGVDKNKIEEDRKIGRIVEKFNRSLKMKKQSNFWEVENGTIIRKVDDIMKKTSQEQPGVVVEEKSNTLVEKKYMIIITQKGKIILERMYKSSLPINFEVVDKVSLKTKTLPMELLEMIDKSVIKYYFNSERPSFSSVVEFIIVCFGLDRVLSDRKTELRDISFSHWVEAFYTLLDNEYIQIVGL